MKTHVLLHRMSGKGLAAHYFFSRQPCIFGDKMVSVQITLNNTTDRKIENIHIGEKKLPTGMEMHVFNSIGKYSYLKLELYLIIKCVHFERKVEYILFY